MIRFPPRLLFASDHASSDGPAPVPPEPIPPLSSNTAPIFSRRTHPNDPPSSRSSSSSASIDPHRTVRVLIHRRARALSPDTADVSPAEDVLPAARPGGEVPGWKGCNANCALTPPRPGSPSRGEPRVEEGKDGAVHLNSLQGKVGGWPSPESLESFVKTWGTLSSVDSFEEREEMSRSVSESPSPRHRAYSMRGADLVLSSQNAPYVRPPAPFIHTEKDFSSDGSLSHEETHTSLSSWLELSSSRPVIPSASLETGSKNQGLSTKQGLQEEPSPRKRHRQLSSRTNSHSSNTQQHHVKRSKFRCPSPAFPDTTTASAGGTSRFQSHIFHRVPHTHAPPTPSHFQRGLGTPRARDLLTKMRADDAAEADKENADLENGLAGPANLGFNAQSTRPRRALVTLRDLLGEGRGKGADRVSVRAAAVGGEGGGIGKRVSSRYRELFEERERVKAMGVDAKP